MFHRQLEAHGTIACNTPARPRPRQVCLCPGSGARAEIQSLCDSPQMVIRRTAAPDCCAATACESAVGDAGACIGSSKPVLAGATPQEVS